MRHRCTSGRKTYRFMRGVVPTTFLLLNFALLLPSGFGGSPAHRTRAGTQGHSARHSRCRVAPGPAGSHHRHSAAGGWPLQHGRRRTGYRRQYLAHAAYAAACKLERVSETQRRAQIMRGPYCPGAQRWRSRASAAAATSALCLLRPSATPSSNPFHHARARKGPFSSPLMDSTV